jgi:large subunit ribosomal protein L10
MNKEQKAQAVEEIASGLTEAEAIFAIDYRGISVPQAKELRVKLSESDAAFKVVKNRLAKRAVEQTGTEGLDGLLEGPTALTLIKGDPVTAAKTIATFSREHNVLVFKGGLMDGAALEPEQFVAIARLPGRDVLYGQLVGMTASPLTGLVAGLANMISGLGRQLTQIADQGLVEGEAPAPAPAAEAPAEEAEAPAAEEPEAEESSSQEEATPAEEEAPSSEEAEESAAAAEGEDTAAESEDVGASDEVAEDQAEPAAPPEPEPDGNEAEGEASGGVITDDDETAAAEGAAGEEE